MKTAIASITCFIVLCGMGASGDEKKTPPVVGAFLVQANGFEFATDFQCDAKKARDKYTPKKAPPGVAGGSVVNVYGVVARADRAGIQLASGNEWTILVKGKSEGKGPYVRISVTGIAIGSDGSKLVVIEGDAERSEKPFDLPVQTK